MQTTRLGQTDLFVTPLSFGTSPLGGIFGAGADDDKRLIDEVLDLGITFIDTAAYYGDAEQRLGRALAGRRDRVIIGSKAGRYPGEEFDHSPARIRASMENSLRLLGTDHLDIFQLHDIEYVDMGPVLEDGYAEMLALRDEGKCRYIGMTGFPIAALTRALTETQLDVALTYAHATLLDDSAVTELVPLAEQRGVGLINASAVALGLLTPEGTSIRNGHPATPEIVRASEKMRALCAQEGVDIAFVANQYSIQRCGCATTLIGTRKVDNLTEAVRAAETPLDEALLAELLALRAEGSHTWPVGLPENN